MSDSLTSYIAYLIKDNRFTEAQSELETKLAAAQENGDKDLTIAHLLRMGDVCHYEGRLDQAAIRYTEALTISAELLLDHSTHDAKYVERGAIYKACLTRFTSCTPRLFITTGNGLELANRFYARSKEIQCGCKGVFANLAVQTATLHKQDNIEPEEGLLTLDELVFDAFVQTENQSSRSRSLFFQMVYEYGLMNEKLIYKLRDWLFSQPKNPEFLAHLLIFFCLVLLLNRDMKSAPIFIDAIAAFDRITLGKPELIIIHTIEKCEDGLVAEACDNLRKIIAANKKPEQLTSIGISMGSVLANYYGCLRRPVPPYLSCIKCGDKSLGDWAKIASQELLFF